MSVCLTVCLRFQYVLWPNLRSPIFQTSPFFNYRNGSFHGVDIINGFSRDCICLHHGTSQVWFEIRLIKKRKLVIFQNAATTKATKKRKPHVKQSKTQKISPPFNIRIIGLRGLKKEIHLTSDALYSAKLNCKQTITHSMIILRAHKLTT